MRDRTPPSVSRDSAGPSGKGVPVWEGFSDRMVAFVDIGVPCDPMGGGGDRIFEVASPPSFFSVGLVAHREIDREAAILPPPRMAPLDLFF